MTKENKPKCVFCKKFTDDSGYIIHFEPLNPVTRGHLLIVHRKHTKDFSEDAEVTADLVRYASQLAKDEHIECNLIISKGKNATQTVFHTHLHLVPRRENDGLYLPWTNQIKENKDLLKTLE